MALTIIHTTKRPKFDVCEITLRLIRVALGIDRPKEEENISSNKAIVEMIRPLYRRMEMRVTEEIILEQLRVRFHDPEKFDDAVLRNAAVVIKEQWKSIAQNFQL